MAQYSALRCIPAFGRIMKNLSFQTGYVLLLLVCWRLLCGFCSILPGTRSPRPPRWQRVCPLKPSARCWDILTLKQHKFTPASLTTKLAAICRGLTRSLSVSKRFIRKLLCKFYYKQFVTYIMGVTICDTHYIIQ